MRRLLPCLLVASLLLPAAAQAQQAGEVQRDLRESQQRLEEIREERADLQRQMDELRSRVEDVSGELRNIERQLSASRSVLAEIEFQVEANEERARANTADLLRTREELRARTAVLNRRLRDIYKRGPLHTVEVLLGAESFADLLNRYRYLHLVARHDRTLVQDVRNLEGELEAQHAQLQATLAELGRLRQSQMGEVAELRQVEEARQRTLSEYRSREERALTRLDELEEDEARLSDLVAELEVGRRAAADGSAAADGPGLPPGDRGGLPWPVEGELAYEFGLDERPNGTVLRWNGIGIRAPPGTPVQAVLPGRVVLAGSFEGYGPTVILSHGDGYYTLYLYLEEVGVVQGRRVEGGQVVGTVGGRDTPEGPRLEFQIRAPGEGGSPRAINPLEWLRPRAADR